MTQSSVRTSSWKQWLEAHAPRLVELARSARFATRTRRRAFEEIYRRRGWGCGPTVSGTGATMAETEAIRHHLPLLVAEFSIASILDLGCGDLWWLRTVNLEADYTGADIVEDLVATNQREYGSSSRRFVCLDAVEDQLPTVDLIMSRSVLVHLSNRGVKRALANIKASRSKYLLTSTFDGHPINKDIVTGMWRPLNLEAPPFSLPPPIRVIDEQCPDPLYRDKKMGLWRVADLPGDAV
jgi:SAM-dependent methyltransferase